MSLTNTNREASGANRLLALRDLRFAGTVAAGLVAGVLGVGALSAPLLGWSGWPDDLRPGREDTVRLATGQLPPQNEGSAARSGTEAPEGTIVVAGPGGSTVVLPVAELGG